MKKIMLPLYVICMGILLCSPAFAYVDPSVTTAVIQAVVAVVVAVGAVAGVLWRKAKKKAQEVLHIDENANKIVEDEVVVTEEPVEAAEEAAAEEEPAAEEKAE